MAHHSPLTFHDYDAGHPWHYFLGGPVRSPKVIRDATVAGGVRGYRRDEIEAANAKAEPARSKALRAIRTEVMQDLWNDLAGYRKRVRDLHRARRTERRTDSPACCDPVHVAVSLKHNHLVNDFAHLHAIDDLMARQGDLFGL